MPWITKDGRSIFIKGPTAPSVVPTRSGTFQATSATRAYGPPPEGKAGFNGHSTTSVIRAAAQHGLDRDQTKQLLTRMNLTAAPNTVYIQHARGKAGEQIPVMAPHHEAEFLSHVAAIKGGGNHQPQVKPETPADTIVPMATQMAAEKRSGTYTPPGSAQPSGTQTPSSVSKPGKWESTYSGYKMQNEHGNFSVEKKSYGGYEIRKGGHRLTGEERMNTLAQAKAFVQEHGHKLAPYRDDVMGGLYVMRSDHPNYKTPTKYEQANVGDLRAGDNVQRGRYGKTLAEAPSWSNGMFNLKYTDGTGEVHNGHMSVTREVKENVPPGSTQDNPSTSAPVHHTGDSFGTDAKAAEMALAAGKQRAAEGHYAVTYRESGTKDFKVRTFDSVFKMSSGIRGMEMAGHKIYGNHQPGVK